MSIRIRVYPQTGAFGAYGGLGGYNRMGAVSAQTYFANRLQTQRQVSSLQLGYERALAEARIENARLEERMKNPYALAATTGLGYGMPGVGAYNPYASSMLGTSMLGGSMFGGFGLGGFLGGLGRMF